MIAFETCVGFNGKVWLKAERPEHTIFVQSALMRISSIMIKLYE